MTRSLVRVRQGPPPFVTTRYQGSKQRLIEFFAAVLALSDVDSVVDVFGGTGVVSHFFKGLGKRVHYNDALASNVATGVALVENARTRLDTERARELLVARPGVRYDDFIARTFHDVFYVPEENAWLDVVSQNVARIEDRFERALALHALFQACMMKRPFNLFHRRNLSVRLASVPRSFGNKTTWERPFPELFLAALAEANAAVFDNGRTNCATRADAFACELDADLAYLDPPYVRADGSSFSYLDGYHFLEGLTEYAAWPDRIDRTKKHLPYAAPRSAFEHPRTIREALFELVEKAMSRCRVVVVSYRDDGIPSIDELAAHMTKLRAVVRVHKRATGYALSKRKSAEALVVATSRAKVSREVLPS